MTPSSATLERGRLEHTRRTTTFQLCVPHACEQRQPRPVWSPRHAPPQERRTIENRTVCDATQQAGPHCQRVRRSEVAGRGRCIGCAVVIAAGRRRSRCRPDGRGSPPHPAIKLPALGMLPIAGCWPRFRGTAIDCSPSPSRQTGAGSPLDRTIDPSASGTLRRSTRLLSSWDPPTTCGRWTAARIRAGGCPAPATTQPVSGKRIR